MSTFTKSLSTPKQEQVANCLLCTEVQLIPLEDRRMATTSLPLYVLGASMLGAP